MCVVIRQNICMWWLYVSSCPKLFFSDDFIQAQQQLARWASEDVVSVVVMESDSSAVDPSPVVAAPSINYHTPLQMRPMVGNGLGAIVSRTDCYPSPPSTTETESSGSVMQQTLLLQQQQQRRGIIEEIGGPQENTGRYPPSVSGEYKPEYKH